LLSSARQSFAGIERADSFIVDPHKWLFAPLDCCALLYKEPHKARDTHTQEAGYLDVVHTGSPTDEWNPADYAIHLSRRPRGLPFWFSLAVNGTNAYQEAIQASIDLAAAAGDLIELHSEVDLLREPSLSIVIFQVRGFAPHEYREWSNYLLDRQIAFVTPTVYEDEIVARLVFLHPDTTIEVVHEILDSIAPFRHRLRTEQGNLDATNVTPRTAHSRYTP
jgi:glutamate/tyrosine decarboxylase-like PLP-dependent enzyme